MVLGTQISQAAPLRRWVMISLGTHVAVAAALWAAGALSNAWTPPPQHVLTTRLVRLGPPRDENLLPRLTAPSAPKPVPKAVSAPQVTSPKVARAHNRAPAPSAATNSALSRLRQELAGQKEGSELGDTDEAQQGDQYAAEIQRCLADHYVIEGSSRSQVMGRTVPVLLRIQADGRIIFHHIERSSGVQAFDQAVDRAVVGCGRVSPPPPSWQKRLRQEGIQIDFQI